MERKVRVFALLLLGLFMLSIFGSFALAQATPPVANLSSSTVFNPVADMFTSWQEGQLSVNIAKYLFAILLALVVFSILGFVPTIGNQGTVVKGLIAAIVAFLATAYLTPSDIYTALASYGALGIVLGAAIPFVILAFFTIQMSQSGQAGGVVLSKVIWFAFILFLIWKIIFGMFFCTLDANGAVDWTSKASAAGTRCINLWEGWVYVAFIIISLIFIIAQRKLVSLWFKEEITAEADLHKRGIKAKLLADIGDLRQQANALRAMGKDAEANRLDARATNMESAL
ncbi:MAG: hypothetical protein Q8Q31_02205 [Nanoarchaeota archaeon]|nr:hypothetical protein [Nanoarchaeota archaeon]